jgi:LmbE family N-acetylglucosaminyl deacetylase
MADATSAEHPMRGWGLPVEGELDRVVIVSPHLDDAVLGCGHFMAAHPGVTVVTVFAGNPPAYPDPMRKWDVQGHFQPGDDVMEVRRAEDRAALAILDATPVHLDNVEFSYNPGDRPTPAAELAATLAPALAPLRPTLVLAPFGLANPDHDMTHRAAMLAREELGSDVALWLYEDNGYKHIPGMLAWRISSLFRRNLWPTPVCPTIDPSDPRKAQAIERYPTQLPALEEDWQISAKLAAPAPEQFWRIAPPPEGWEGLRDA